MSLTTNNFYGPRGKRKVCHISKVLDENVKRLKAEKIPKEFRPRLDGPSVGWKSFFRQQDAFNYARSRALDLHVFSYESKSLESQTGQRMFLVASYEEFWHYYRQLEQDQKHHYEIIPEGAVCKLYFDLEFPQEKNLSCDGSHMTNIFIKYVSLWLEEKFNVKCWREFVLDLDASTEKKFSRHLIFQLKKVAFKDNIHAGNFVKFIIQKLKAEISKLKQNISDVLDFDEIPLTPSKSDDPHEESAPGKNGKEENAHSKQCEKIFEKFTEEDLLSLIVRDKNNEETLFCDQGVYTKNRNFRLYLSSKFGKDNPLILSKDNIYRPVLKDGKMFLDHQIFSDSLIANIEYSPSLRILQFGSEENCMDKCINEYGPVKSAEKSEDVVEGYTKSPFPETDDFITSTLNNKGKQGRIRHWTYFSQGEIIVYDISGYRFCHNIGREHKSNNIMLLADLKRGVYYQKCYDPECKAKNFKSKDMEIPKEALPSFYFDDSFDEFDEGVDDMDMLNAAIEAEKNLES